MWVQMFWIVFAMVATIILVTFIMAVFLCVSAANAISEDYRKQAEDNAYYF